MTWPSLAAIQTAKKNVRFQGPEKRQTDTLRRARKDGDHQKATESRKKQKLKKIFNKPIIISEESNNKSKNKLENFWLVDPLDGTKEFIKKNGEFTVNIAFIKKNKPVFGVIYAPKLKKTYVTFSNTY